MMGLSSFLFQGKWECFIIRPREGSYSIKEEILMTKEKKKSTWKKEDRDFLRK